MQFRRISYCCKSLVLITVLLSTSGCQTNPIKSAPDLSSVPFVGSLFSTPLTELTKLTAAGDLHAADAIYRENQSYFHENEAKCNSALKALGHNIDDYFSTDLAIYTAFIRQLNNQWPPQMSDWTEHRSNYEKATNIYNSLKEFNVLESDNYRTERIGQFFSSYDSVTHKGENDAVSMLVTYNLTAQHTFFDTYPVKITSVNDVMNDARPMLIDRLANLSIAELQNWSSNYPVSEEQKEKYGWGILTAASKSSDIKSLLNIAKIFDIAPDRLFSELFSTIVSTDSVLPSVIVEGSNVYQRAYRDTINETLQKCDGKPVLLVHIHGVQVNREIVDQRTVQSRYVSKTITIPNPEYQSALQEVQAAQNQYTTTQIRNTFTPCYGWGCVGQALGEVGYAVAVNNAKQKLASTPPTIKENVYSEYSYQVTDIEVTKEAPVSIFILDKHGTGKEIGKDILVTSKTYHVAYGRRKDDNGKKYSLEKSYDDEGDVPSANASQVDLNLSELSLMLGSTNQKNIPNYGTLIASISADKSHMLKASPKTAVVMSPKAKSDSRIKSVVVVEPASGSSFGSGFFVKKGVVLTNNHVVDESSLVKLRDSMGNIDTGEVIARDIKRDLALVKTKLAGTPAILDLDNVPVGGTVEAIGHPEGLLFTVSRGIIGALREKESKYDKSGDPILLIQTDAPINPGNSGGPLFLGKRVVGVNTWKISSESVEGIGFAVHASEVKRFLLKNGY